MGFKNWIKRKGRFVLSRVLISTVAVTFLCNQPLIASAVSQVRAETGLFKISGYIMPDLISDNTGINGGFKIELAGTGLSAQTNGEGYFEVNNVPYSLPGYTITVSKDNYLHRVQQYVMVEADIQLGSKEEPIDMWAGDIKSGGVQDNVINMADVMEIAKSFNCIFGEGNYNPNADLNNDYVNNMADLMILAKHFNSTANEYPLIPINITSNGTEICRWKDNKKGAYTPTFDDAWLIPSHEKVAALMKQYGLKGTIDWDTGGAWDDAWNRLKTILDQGYFDVASHSVTHPDLTTMTAEQIEKEMADSKSTIEAKTGYKCEAFAYPNSTFNSTTMEIASKYYVVARTGGASLNSYDATNYYNLASKLNASATTVGELNSWVDDAVNTGSWLIVLSHGTDGLGWEPSPLSKIDSHFQYVQSKKDSVWTEGLAGVGKYIRERQNANIQQLSYTYSEIILNLTDTLDDTTYNYPLTLKTKVPDHWATVIFTQGNNQTLKDVVTEGTGKYVYFDAIPDKGQITLAASK